MNKTYVSEDPFKVLDVKYSDDLKTIREKFKKLVLKYHPDRKYGDADKFQRIKDSYAYIFKFKKSQQNEYQKQNRTFEKYLEDRGIEDKITQNRRTRKQVLQPNNLDSATFNDIFEKNKIKDAYDTGRQDFLKDEMNKTKMQIKVVDEPEIFPDFGNIRQLGVETVDDFSTYVKRKNNKEISCSDIKYAYANREILEHNMKNIRGDSYLKNADQVDKLQRKRNNISYEMSTQEKLWNDMKQKELEEKEQKRLHFINKQKEISERQFLRVSKYLTN